MDSYLNQPFLTKRRNYARWGSYIGLGALVLGLMTSARYPLLSYAFLVVGLLAASFGSYTANRYVREPRADQMLNKALEGLDKRYALYHYYFATSHVLASHLGLTVLLPRLQEGEITYEEGRWRHKAGLRKFLQLFGEPSLGKPQVELEEDVRWLKEWVDAAMPGDNIPVTGAIVFTNPRATVRASQAPVPALTPEQLVGFLKQGLRGQVSVLSTAKQKELRRVLDEAIAAA
jgi:hypothetical protein